MPGPGSPKPVNLAAVAACRWAAAAAAAACPSPPSGIWPQGDPERAWLIPKALEGRRPAAAICWAAAIARAALLTAAAFWITAADCCAAAIWDARAATGFAAPAARSVERKSTRTLLHARRAPHETKASAYLWYPGR